MLPDPDHVLPPLPHGRPRRARRPVSLAAVAVVAALVLAACATKPPENPDARACLPPENPAMKARDYNMRVAGYTNRADAFARCMTEHGYVLDEQELDARLTHFEAVKNANVMGGDPGWAMRIEEQELRVNSELWRPSDAPSPPPKTQP